MRPACALVVRNQRKETDHTLKAKHLFQSLQPNLSYFRCTARRTQNFSSGWISSSLRTMCQAQRSHSSMCTSLCCSNSAQLVHCQPAPSSPHFPPTMASIFCIRSFDSGNPGEMVILGMPIKEHLDWAEIGRCTLSVCSIIPWAGVLDCKKATVQLSTSTHHSLPPDSWYNGWLHHAFFSVVG